MSVEALEGVEGEMGETVTSTVSGSAEGGVVSKLWRGESGLVWC